MAINELMLNPADLLGFTQQVRQSDPYGLAAQSLSQFQPDTRMFSAGELGATAFGKSFLSGLLGNYANERANRQLSSVVQALPQLNSDPYGMTTPEGVDSGAFNLLRGSAILKKAQKDTVLGDEKKTAVGDLLKSVLGEGVKAGTISPQAALKAIETGDMSALEGMDTSKNPNSPQYKMQKDLDEKTIALRKEFNALDPVKNFAKASQAATALAGALKDNSKVSDQELVRYSILMIEPGMAVREGEQGAVKMSQSIPEAFRGQMLGALSGKTELGPDVREGIKNLASRAYNSHKGLYDQANELYTKEATLQGVDPSRISYIGQAPEAASIFGGNQPAAPAMDLGSFISEAKAKGLSKEQAKAQWMSMGGTGF